MTGEMDESITLHIPGRPATVAPLVGVDGAWLDGAQVVVWKQVRDGFGASAPMSVPDAAVEIVCRREAGASLLAVVKNIVDGLDEHDIIDSDRNVCIIKAVLDESDPAATVVVSWPDDGFSAGKKRKYPLGGVLAKSSETLAAPVGKRPLVARSGEFVYRDVDAYVSELLAQWDELSPSLDTETLARIAHLPEGGPYRLTIAVAGKKTADLENIMARAVHLLHVGAHAARTRHADELWNTQPSLEGLITELEAYRADLTPVGITVSLTPLDSVDKPLVDIAQIRALRQQGVPHPQIDTARNSPRLGKAKKPRSPR